jgi:hypothetical protein
MATNTVLVWVAIIHAIFASLALLSLRRRRGGLILVLVWVVIIVGLPLLGPLFFAAFCDPPSVLPPNRRVGVNVNIPGSKKILDREHGVQSEDAIWTEPHNP